MDQFGIFQRLVLYWNELYGYSFLIELFFFFRIRLKCFLVFSPPWFSKKETFVIISVCIFWCQNASGLCLPNNADHRSGFWPRERNSNISSRSARWFIRSRILVFPVGHRFPVWAALRRFKHLFSSKMKSYSSSHSPQKRFLLALMWTAICLLCCCAASPVVSGAPSLDE